MTFTTNLSWRGVMAGLPFGVAALELIDKWERDEDSARMAALWTVDSLLDNCDAMSLDQAQRISAVYGTAAHVALIREVERKEAARVERLCVLPWSDESTDCATAAARVAEAILDQGPCYIACTDSDEQLGHVARNAAQACRVPYLLALTVCRELRGDYMTPGARADLESRQLAGFYE